MKKLFLIYSLLMFSLPVLALDSPVGTWITVDDATHKPRSVVRISLHNAKLDGTIRKVFKQPGDTGRCHNCKGRFRNKRVVGLRFMWGLKQTGQRTWSDGRILDPKSGRIYSCKITLSEDNKRLTVRGYIGISLLGRSQYWLRKA
jgi:uncharacterized protein (DUF2147 family)